MAGSINKVILVGNVGKDPEIRSTHDRREIANLTLATSESWKDKNSGERMEKTEWHRIVCFNPGLIGVIKNYVKKGAKLYIEGELRTRKWTDTRDNLEKYSTEVVLQGYSCNLTMLSTSNSGDSGARTEHHRDENRQSENRSTQNDTSSSDHLNDDIPF